MLSVSDGRVSLRIQRVAPAGDAALTRGGPGSGLTRRDFLALAALPVIVGVGADKPAVAYYNGLELEIDGPVVITRSPGAVFDLPRGPRVVPPKIRYQFEAYIDLPRNAKLLHPLAVKLAEANQPRAATKQDPDWYHDAAAHHLIIDASGTLQLAGEPAREVQAMGGVQFTDYWEPGRREDRRRKNIMFAVIDCVHSVIAAEA